MSAIFTVESQFASPNPIGFGGRPEAKIVAIKNVISPMLIVPLPLASPAVIQVKETVELKVGGLYEPQSVTIVGRSAPQPENEIKFVSTVAPLGILKNKLRIGPVPAGRYEPVPDVWAVMV